jgi:16S rRNA (cytosine967-C5)-methyltransferase
MAFDLLRRINGQRAYANLALSQALSQAGWSGQQAGLVTELVAGTCRRQGSYDAIIERAGGRSLKTFQPAVLDLLRLGCHHVLGLRLPSPIAVTTSVDLAAATVGPRVTGLVNAILRRVAEYSLADWLDLLAAGQPPLDALAIRTSHPRWITEVYVDHLGLNEAALALAANNEPPRTCLAIRPGLATAAELIETGGQPGQWVPTAVYWPGDPGQSALVQTGRAGVEDEGSQVVAEIFADLEAPAGLWLDLCAGPGGKTALLAGWARQRGDDLVASEISPGRAGLVRANLRAYDNPPPVIVADGRQPPWPPASFARVLVDAPCTGLGALRRRPEARWRKQPSDLADLVPQQQALVLSAVNLLQPGGVAAYVTCSPHPAETSAVVEAVLAEVGGEVQLEAVTPPRSLPEATAGPYLQLWPHRHGTDAMFCALLRRTSR